jgi:hypothetical protein
MGQSINENLIRVKGDLTKIGPKKMSEIISDIRYLPLETNSECLIGYMNVKVFDKNIIIKCNDEGDGIYRFSDQGKFLNKIGNKGRGPEEYVDDKEVHLIRDTIFVVSNFSNTIICYSLEGKFLKRYHLNLNGDPASIVNLPDNSYMVALSSTSKSGRLIKTNSSFQSISGFFKDLPVRYSPYPLPLTKSNNRILYFYTVSDTIYDVSCGNPLPYIFIDFGKNKKPNGFVSKPGDSKDDYEYPIITNLGASNDFLNLLYFYMPERLTWNVLYRFKDEKVVQFTDLINDVDNGSNIEGYVKLTNDNQIIVPLHATTIIDRYSKMTKTEKSDPKSRRFIEIASKISPESNPVLMICKLK